MQQLTLWSMMPTRGWLGPSAWWLQFDHPGPCAAFGCLLMPPGRPVLTVKPSRFISIRAWCFLRSPYSPHHLTLDAQAERACTGLPLLERGRPSNPATPSCRRAYLRHPGPPCQLAGLQRCHHPMHRHRFQDLQRKGPGARHHRAGAACAGTSSIVGVPSCQRASAAWCSTGACSSRQGGNGDKWTCNGPCTERQDRPICLSANDQAPSPTAFAPPSCNPPLGTCPC